MSLRAAVFGGLAALAVTAPAAQAQGTGPVACGQDYTVVRGDSLREIAIRAYNNANYQIIFNANSGLIANPSLIRVGWRIFIPCIDGSGPATRAEAGTGGGTVAAATPELPAAPPPEAPSVHTIKFLTGSDYAPFTDEGLPEGGMITELVRRAMARADDTRPYRIDFVNDWASHLGLLLPQGMFDLGFPWFKPDCSKLDMLSPPMAARCTNFDFSYPFYEIVIGYYALADGPAANAHDPEDLFGLRICRPKGYFTFDLEQEGLKPPTIAMVNPVLPGGCLEALVDGEADVVTMNVLLVEKAIADMGLMDRVVALEDLSTVQTLHVLSPKTNPYGRTYISLINRGLRQMRESGEWFDVVSHHLALYAQSQQ